MIYLMFITAFALSATAAYYSIMGLTAIFAAAVIPIIIMGSILEVAKLVVASWLYRNWKEVPLLMKSYFTVALIVLMTLTSMGIFGYLSKAHLDQAIPSGDITAKVALIDEKIKNERETIDAARQTILQLDTQVNQTISRTSNDTTDTGIRRSIKVRKLQGKERQELYSTIQVSNAKILGYQEERAPLATELRKVEAEVGPIKYIAALIYGDNLDESFLEKAVRVVILMIVSVFDPLAVLMLVAANWSLKHIRKEELKVEDTGWHQEWVPDSETWPPYEPDFLDIEEIRKQSGVDQDMEMTQHLFDTEEEFFAHGKEIAKELDASENKKSNDFWESLANSSDEVPSPPPPKIKELEEPLEYDSHGRLLTVPKK